MPGDDGDTRPVFPSRSPASIPRPHPPHSENQTPQRTPSHRARDLPSVAEKLTTRFHRSPCRGGQSF